MANNHSSIKDSKECFDNVLNVAEEIQPETSFKDSDPLVANIKRLYQFAIQEIRKMNFEKIKDNLIELELLQKNTIETHIIHAFLCIASDNPIDAFYYLKKFTDKNFKPNIIIKEFIAHWNYSAKFYDVAVFQYVELLKENPERKLLIPILMRVALCKKRLGDFINADYILDILFATPEGYKNYMFFMIEKIHINILQKNFSKALELFGKCGGIDNCVMIDRLYAFMLYSEGKIPELLNFCNKAKKDSYIIYLLVRTEMEYPNFENSLESNFSYLLKNNKNNVSVLTTYANYQLLNGLYTLGMETYEKIVKIDREYYPGIQNWVYLCSEFQFIDNGWIPKNPDFRNQNLLVDVDCNPEFLGFYQNDCKEFPKEFSCHIPSDYIHPLVYKDSYKD